MKFIILAPRKNSGGQLALYLLCKGLEEQGHDAKILLLFHCIKPGQVRSLVRFWLYWGLTNAVDIARHIFYSASKFLTGGDKILFHDFFREPVKGCKRKWLPIISDDTIVVYPDIVYGNVLNAKKVVRYLMYFNRFPEDINAYGKNDLFFCYRDIFNDLKLNPEVNVLCLQHFDFDLYHQYNYGERTGCCYVIRKGSHRADLPGRFDGPVIDNWNEVAKVEAFNRFKYCYFYDTQTFYTAIAAVCGCIPVVILEPGKTKHDYLATGDQPLGVAFGNTPEEIDYAIRTRQNCIDNLNLFDEWNRNGIKFFLSVCKRYFT